MYPYNHKKNDTMSNNKIEENIINAARTEFVKHGYECTSMSEIAARAGINRPTLHYYFRTKEKMFQAVFGDIVETFIPDIQSIAESDLPFIDKLKAIIDKYIATFAQNPDVPCFIINEIERDPQHLLATAQELHYDKFLKTLHQSMLKEIEAGKIKPIAPEKMFCTFYGLLVFPIVSKKVTKIIFFDNQESDYQEFMQNWKEHIIRIMQNLISL